jgi:hypothetical protein
VILRIPFSPFQILRFFHHFSPQGKNPAVFSSLFAAGPQGKNPAVFQKLFAARPQG